MFPEKQQALGKVIDRGLLFMYQIDTSSVLRGITRPASQNPWDETGDVVKA